PITNRFDSGAKATASGPRASPEAPTASASAGRHSPNPKHSTCLTGKTGSSPSTDGDSSSSTIRTRAGSTCNPATFAPTNPRPPPGSDPGVTPELPRSHHEPPRREQSAYHGNRRPTVPSTARLLLLIP